MPLVFQYGSNCDESRLNSQDRLCGRAKFYGVAHTVDPHELTFSVQTGQKNNYAAAAHIESGTGRDIWGVLYQVPPRWLSRQLRGRHKCLDQVEAEGRNYLRKKIRVKPINGRVLHVHTYVAQNPQPNLPTSLDYVQHIVTGLRSHGVPEEYIRYVKQRTILNNPTLAADIANL